MFIPIPENYDEYVTSTAKVLNSDFSDIPAENLEKIKEVVQTIAAAKNSTDFKDVVETNFPLIVNDPKFTPAERVLFVRLLTDKNVNLTFSIFPWFQDFVMSYGKLLRTARCAQR